MMGTKEAGIHDLSAKPKPGKRGSNEYGASYSAVDDRDDYLEFRYHDPLQHHLGENG